MTRSDTKSLIALSAMAGIIVGLSSFAVASPAQANNHHRYGGRHIRNYPVGYTAVPVGANYGNPGMPIGYSSIPAGSSYGNPNIPIGYGQDYSNPNLNPYGIVGPSAYYGR